jgi:hypothetical protein
MAKEVEHTIDSPSDDVTLDKENEIDDDHDSEEIVDETVNAPTPKRRTGRKAFIIPEAASPLDLEDEPTPFKRSISRIKARSKYLSSIQELFPKAPRPRKAKKSAQGIGLIQAKPSPQAGIRGGRADYDAAARTKTARGAVTTRPTEVATRLDTSGTRPLVEAVRAAYSRCGHACFTDACALAHGRFPTMATSINGGASTSRKCNPKMPGASRFSKTGRYRVTSTTIFVAAHPTRTSPNRMC